jgi:hypothetical protein
MSAPNTKAELIEIYEKALGRGEYDLADQIRQELQDKQKDGWSTIYWQCPMKHNPPSIQAIGAKCYVCGLR